MKQTCSNCKWLKELPFSDEFICENENSDYADCPCESNDYCDEFVERDS